MQNKGNIPPIFNYLAPGAGKTPNLSRPISPPPKIPRNLAVCSGSLNDHAAQTEPVYQNDEEAQTYPVSVPDDLAEAYYNLAARYDVLRDELNTYKGAHEELQAKYLKNKKIWEAWTKTDAERREQLKKRKRDESAIPEAGRQITHGYTTPAASIAGRSPHSRAPPTLSPNKPISRPPVPYIGSKKPDLFTGFKRSAEKIKDFGDLGITPTNIKSTDREGLAAPGKIHHSESDGSDSSWPSSVPETQTLPTAIAQKNPESVAVPNIDEATDGESSSIIIPKVKSFNRLGLIGEESPVLPLHPVPVPKTPKIKKEKSYSKRARSGDSVVHPVVIKTESSGVSSEDFGYHLFEEDSLDLDDIGYKPDTPRKRRRDYELPMEEPRSSGSSARVGWINGGFTIKRAPDAPETQYPNEMGDEETQDEDEGIMFNNEEFLVPEFPPLSMNYEELGEIKTDSQLARPQTPPGVTSTPSVRTHKKKNTDYIKRGRATGKGNRLDSGEMRISPPPLKNRPTSVSDQPPSATPIRGGLSAVGRSIHHDGLPRAKRRITSANAIANITEDGTDGIEDIHSDCDILPHPPMMLTEEQRKELEVITRLDDILNSPAPKTPSLAHLEKKMDVSKSAPAKNLLRKSFDNISSSEPPKQNAWIDPTRYNKGYNKGIREKQAPRDPYNLDISHFRVNPDVNEGRDYAFAETVRNREARKCLPGCVKTCCKELAGFVEAAGLPSPAPRGPRWRSSSPPASIDGTQVNEVEEEEEALDRQFTAKFGKHRDAFARRRSPPGFWNADFPDTQVIGEQNKVAEEMRMEKVEGMRKEAEKGGKGRYVYRGTGAGSW